MVFGLRVRSRKILDSNFKLKTSEDGDGLQNVAIGLTARQDGGCGGDDGPRFG